MSENEVSITIPAMARRSGVNPTALYNKQVHNMTIPERIVFFNKWIPAMQVEQKKLTVRIDGAIISRIAMEQAVNDE